MHIQLKNKTKKNNEKFLKRVRDSTERPKIRRLRRNGKYFKNTKKKKFYFRTLKIFLKVIFTWS